MFSDKEFIAYYSEKINAWSNEDLVNFLTNRLASVLMEISPHTRNSHFNSTYVNQIYRIITNEEYKETYDNYISFLKRRNEQSYSENRFNIYDVIGDYFHA